MTENYFVVNLVNSIAYQSRGLMYSISLQGLPCHDRQQKKLHRKKKCPSASSYSPAKDGGGWETKTKTKENNDNTQNESTFKKNGRGKERGKKRKRKTTNLD